MRTDAIAGLLRRVDDDSPAYDKALFHAVTALEHIAETGPDREDVVTARVALRRINAALDNIERGERDA